jgi:hypothetical protein
MPNESYSGTYKGAQAPGGTLEPLFDWAKSKQNHEQTMERTRLEDTLLNKRQEKANEFSTILEQMREQGRMQLQNAAFQQSQQAELQRGQALADYTGGLAVQEAQKGNVIDALVERQPALDTPEAAMPGYVPRQINPLAATAAHGDLLKGIETRARTDEQVRLKRTQELLDAVGPDEITQAQTLIPILRTHGQDVLATQLEGLRPGMWDKNRLQTEISKANTNIENNRARLERVKIFSDERMRIAAEANETKKEVARIASKAKLDANDAKETREQRLRMGARIATINGTIAIIQRELADITIPATTRAKLQDDLREAKMVRDNLDNTQAKMFEIEDRYLHQPPPVPKATAADAQKQVRDIIDNLIRKKGKQFEELTPDEQKKVIEAMAQRGFDPRKR